eukprot:12893845-Prorocentrum_lima.AAC.1
MEELRILPCHQLRGLHGVLDGLVDLEWLPFNHLEGYGIQTPRATLLVACDGTYTDALPLKA